VSALTLGDYLDRTGSFWKELLSPTAAQNILESNVCFPEVD